jgi:hypothetical protein
MQVRFADKSWRLDLDPSAEAAVEVYSRWAPGTVSQALAGSRDAAPTTVVVLWMLKGRAQLKVEGEQYSLQAPPGPAYFHWINFSGHDSGPQRRDNLPSWFTQPAPSEAEGVRKAVERQRQRLGERSVDSVLTEELQAPEVDTRKLAVYGLAAIDDVGHVVDALADPRHDEVREAAIQALAHWIGRGVREVHNLREFLIKQRDYTPSQATIFLQLLGGLSEDRDRQQPETYETLIAYLRHQKLAIRALALHQLLQWVPQGKSIGYDPAASEQDREHAYAEWKKLIPTGKLPPKLQRAKSHSALPPDMAMPQRRS